MPRTSRGIRGLGRVGLSLLALASLAAPSEAAFGYRKAITVQAGQVAAGPHANFPLLVSLTDPNLATVANGGRVESAAGYDIIFRGEDVTTCGGPATCRLEHEIERYDPTTGTLIAWVRVPSVNDGTSILVYYGDATITLPTQAPKAVWEPDSPTTPGYVGVWHLGESGAGTPLEFRDSSKNANHGQGGEGDPLFLPTQVAGKIGNAQDFAPGAGTNPKTPPPDGEFDVIDVGHSARFDFPSDQITLQAWVQHNIVPAFTENYGLLAHKGFGIGYRLILEENTNQLEFSLPATSLVTTASLGTGSWHHVVATYDGATMRVYIDGVQDPTTAARTGNIIPATGGDAEVYIGAGDQPKDRPWTYDFVGQIDEVRISRVARTAGWVLTEYRNHNAPASFYASGLEQTGPFPTPAFTLLTINYRSIGTNGGTLYGTGDASVGLGSRVVAFGGGASLPTNGGTGDVLTFTGAPAEILLIQSRDSATQVTLQTPATSAHTSQTYTVTRAFTTLAAWETARQGDLVTENRREVGVAYNDGAFTAGAAIAGWTTDSVRYPMLTVADGQRHDGTAGTGVVLDGMDTDQGIRASTPHLVVDGFEFRRNREAGGSATSVVVQNSAHDVLLQNLLIHDFFLAGESVSGIRGQMDSDYVVRNTIIYDGDIGIRNNAATANGIVENVTVYGMDRWGVLASAGNLNVRNTISMDNLTADFSGTMIQAANLSSDATATGSGSLPGRVAANQFVSIAPASEDLHLKAGADAIDRGLSSYLPQYWTDVDAASRPFTPVAIAGTPGPWDVGADEFGATTAVELQSFAASGADGAVDLAWSTASELDNLGFHLYRADAAEGPYTRITSSLIPGLGSSPTGASYSYRDGGLQNGRTYYYELQDVETTGRTERHGPVSAAPVAGGGSEEGGDKGAPGEGETSGGEWTPRREASGRIVYGHPEEASFRIVERGPSHALVELLTPGFYAVPEGDGTFRLEVPGFDSASVPGAPDVPVRRAFVEAVAGRRVRLASVVASEEIRFEDLRVATAGAPAIVVTDTGIVKPGHRRSKKSSPIGLFPRSTARKLGVSFQGETKKARLELGPLRYDSRGRTVVLTERLLVRLSFSGAEPGESGVSGSRGRRPAVLPRMRGSGVVAELVTKEAGLYALRYEDVFAGRRAVAASSLRLARLGVGVAYHLEPPTAAFGPGSTLYFVSEGSGANPWGDAVNTLETGKAGDVMPSLSASPSGSTALEYLDVKEWEENRFYQAGLLEAPDLWQWDLVLAPATKSYSFTLLELSPGSTYARLTVWLQGASDFDEDPDHHVRLLLNGQSVAEAAWDGRTEKVIEAEVRPGILGEGANALAVENVGDTGATYSMVFLNRFSLRYPRRLQAENGSLTGSFGESGTAEVAGLGADAIVLDTHEGPRWLRGLQAAGTGVAFRAEAGRTYLATARSAVRRPEVRKTTRSTLRSKRHRADWLLIAPKEFLPVARPLLELRRRQGLRVMAVSVEEIDQEFGFGERGPRSIKDFLAYAYESWRRPSFRYVLLLGDGSYDPKDYLKTGVKDRIPPFLTKTSYLWTASDPAYAAVNGEDLLPDVAVGRLSAGTVEEARILVEKTVAFEAAGRTLEGGAVLVADNADGGGRFEADADEVASTVLASREVERVYLRDLGGGTRATIVAAFDRAPGLVSYAGHGGTAVWASENIFNNTDVASLAAQEKHPLLLTMNCLNGFFHFPPFDSLAEALVKAEGKGAIAAFSPSGLSLNDAAHVYHKALLTEIESGQHARLGDAILAAQSAYADTGARPELLSIYHLLGDPALTIR